MWNTYSTLDGNAKNCHSVVGIWHFLMLLVNASVLLMVYKVIWEKSQKSFKLIILKLTMYLHHTQSSHCFSSLLQKFFFRVLKTQCYCFSSFVMSNIKKICNEIKRQYIMSIYSDRDFLQTLSLTRSHPWACPHESFSKNPPRSF